MARFNKSSVEKLIAEGTAEVVSATRQPVGKFGDLPMPKVVKSSRPLPPVEKLPPLAISVTFHAKVHIESEMNLREHWASRKRRYDLQEAQVKKVLKQAGFLPAALAEWRQANAGKMRVAFTRYGKRKLDDDNLQSGFKHVRDVVARWVDVDDGSDVWNWVYDQQTGSDYRITITISTEAAT